jgi:hypothetical protein
MFRRLHHRVRARLVSTAATCMAAVLLASPPLRAQQAPGPSPTPTAAPRPWADRDGSTAAAAKGGASTSASRQAAAAGRRDSAAAAAPEPVWPALPALRDGAVLPAERVVAFYGNPRSARMGILGALPPQQMMAKLDTVAMQWLAADTTRGVKPALHLIATVAQEHEGADRKHRLRMPEALIDTVYGWARSRGWLLFLDVQPGWSTVEAELPRLRKWLAEPTVHLALDPEFTMPAGQVPGKRIGTMDAAAVNYAIGLLAGLVDSLGLPPKMLVVHRFTDRMLTNAAKIAADPRVQVIVDMDGFGSPELKLATWRRVVVREPVQYTGLKLFYKNDRPLLTPAEVLRRFRPAPLYIQYQ